MFWTNLQNPYFGRCSVINWQLNIAMALVWNQVADRALVGMWCCTFNWSFWIGYAHNLKFLFLTASRHKIIWTSNFGVGSVVVFSQLKKIYISTVGRHFFSSKFLIQFWYVTLGRITLCWAPFITGKLHKIFCRIVQEIRKKKWDFIFDSGGSLWDKKENRNQTLGATF